MILKSKVNLLIPKFELQPKPFWMKKLILILALNLFLEANAQIKFGDFKYNGALNFNAIKTAANAHFEKQGIKNQILPFAKKEEDNDYLRYKRWEWYWQTRVTEEGSFPNLLEQAAIYTSYSSTDYRTNSANTAWVNISQTSTTGGYNGMGRLTSIAFHPSNPDIFWVGAPIGGIWKTIDGGLTYSPLGDALPYCSVGNIVVDEVNPDIIYISLGDHGGWWQYGLGVYKTTDGGITWLPTSLNSDFSDGIAYYSMAMCPGNSNKILVARSNGLFRTVDGGNTWAMVRNGAHKDVKYRPNDSSTVYASSDDYWGSSEVYKSVNGGLNFSQVSAFSSAQKTIMLAVTPANPNILGVMVSGGTTKSYYKSSHNGSNLNFVSNLPEAAVIYISHLDSNKVYSGYTKIYQSLNSGQTWIQKTNWYNNGIHTEIHADQRFVKHNPLNDLLYFCNDGGLSNYDEVFDSWGELNNGLIITQFYSIAVAQNDPIFMIGGTQDNGGRKRTGLTTWAATNGGDAMETAIDQSNNQTIYTTYINGQLYRSYDQWTNDTYYDITPSGVSGNWETPYTLDPANQSTILAGYEDVYKSINQGANWNKISNNLTGSSTDYLDKLEIAPSNSNVIYASRANKLYKTNTGAAPWTSYTLPFTTSNFSKITSISIDPTNSSLIYLTIGGYSAGKKVYRSSTGGSSWTNISGTLPNIPINASVIDETSPNHELYIGTDIGVFYINDTNSVWTYWGTNLPNTSVTDLKIHSSSHKLRAATYGRGIWESDLLSVVTALPTNAQSLGKNSIQLAFNPVGKIVLLNAFIKKDMQAAIKIFNVAGSKIYSQQKHFQIGNYQFGLAVGDFPTGLYYINIETDEGATTLKFLHSPE
jgi:photosystem II stability/assembly factor-like uncharacterized protein